MMETTNTSQITLPMDMQHWEQGLSLRDFVAQMTVDREAMTRRFEAVQPSKEERVAASALQRPLRVLVMTEDWCGDCLMSLPILARLTEVAPDMKARVFIRTRWPDLQAWFAANNITAIPIFGFLDEDFQLIGTWVERSKAANERIKRWKEEHPETQAIQQDASLSKEKRKTRLAHIYTGLKTEMETWYAESLQAATVQEIVDILK